MAACMESQFDKQEYLYNQKGGTYGISCSIEQNTIFHGNHS